jgi:hypothetical protein
MSNEGISIIENAAAMGLPVPAKLRDVFAKLNTDNAKTIIADNWVETAQTENMGGDEESDDTEDND